MESNRNENRLTRRCEANGVKWSALYELNYWNPQKHVVLGYMHNWNEGILKDHLRTMWGIGRDSGHTQTAAQRDIDEQFDDADMEELVSELEDLKDEVKEWNKRQARILQTPPPQSQTPSTDGDDLESNLPRTPLRRDTFFDPQTPTQKKSESDHNQRSARSTTETEEAHSKVGLQ